MENTINFKIRIVLTLASALLLSACSLNPVTGDRQFTGLMTPEQEVQIGAQQDKEISAHYGGVYKNNALQSYVNDVGQKMAVRSDRAAVSYHFTVLDSPIVNAFALPGGYVYITRGTLAVAQNEAQLAAVLGHEVGHVAARHQAAQYSTGVVTSLGAGILAAVVGSPALNDVLNVGTNLYLSSYSRDQEREADTLGVRYLARTGYDPFAMAGFLRGMDIYLDEESSITGDGKQTATYFSTHPDTGQRVGLAAQDAQTVAPPLPPVTGDSRYLQAISGMTFGDGAAQGFARDGKFYHPDIGFVLDVPRGFKVKNSTDSLVLEGVLEGGQNTAILLDVDDNRTMGDAVDYMNNQWLKRANALPVEPITIHGRSGATTMLRGTLGNRPVDVRLIALEWANDKIIRLQIVIPRGARAQVVDNLKRTSYSVRSMNADERAQIRPYRIRLVTALSGDTQNTLARKMAVRDNALAWLRAINGLMPADPIVSGHQYKIVE